MASLACGAKTAISGSWRKAIGASSAPAASASAASG